MLYLSSTMYSCTSPASVCRNSPPSSTVRQFFSRDLLLMRAVQLLFSALPPTFSNPEALRGDAEPVVSGRLQRSIQFLHIEPLHTLHFLFLQDKLRSIYRLSVHIDECNLVVPKHFSMKFLFVLNIKASGELQFLFRCLDSQFFVKFPYCRFLRLVPRLNMSGGRSIEPPRKAVFFCRAFLQ